jgi:hypothetical protein
MGEQTRLEGMRFDAQALESKQNSILQGTLNHLEFFAREFTFCEAHSGQLEGVVLTPAAPHLLHSLPTSA